ncbi:hypothetical protein [Actinokineospora inagensis]|uniref:hypothetical protein n=1 Tax=Actinokineospora inagensis TaxID=103730 RepID=UPI00041A844B|nr:hypothetical protein [Actinokineospora inagensis]
MISTFTTALRTRPEPGTTAPVDWSDAPWPVKVYAAGPRFADQAEDSTRGWVLRVLTEAVGVSRAVTTGGRTVVRRPVASGGALYPTEVYALFDGAAHHFDVARHELVTLGRAGNGVELVLTHRFWKNFYKYGDFAYRLGAVDVGVVLGRLRTVITAHGGASEIAFDFADAAIHSLLDLTDEGAYAIVRVTPPVTRSMPPVLPVHTPPVRERSTVVRRSRDLLAMHLAAQVPAPPAPPPPPLTGERTPLPPPAATDYRVETVRRRRSAGPSFTGAPLPATTLAAVLSCADSDLQVLCAIRAVDGYRPGWYGYDHHGYDHHALVHLNPDQDPTGTLQSALYRPGMNLAAAAFTVHLAGCLDYPGARSYRVQQMRVGMAIDAVTLACAALGASAHPFLGFDAAAVDESYRLPAGVGTLAQLCVGVAAGAPVLSGRVW